MDKERGGQAGFLSRRAAHEAAERHVLIVHITAIAIIIFPRIRIVAVGQFEN